MTDDLEIIAELHPQHGGDMGVLREMIRAARQGGATAVKVQLYDAHALLGEAWAHLEMTRPQLETVRAWCDQEGLELMASVFDAERVDWCVDLDLPRFKIASRTVVDDPALCERILAEGKETIISLGQWQGDEPPFPPSPQIRYLYCKSLYPAFWEDMHDFPTDFAADGLAGFSDHTLGIELCLVAIARGAGMIEKHFTLDKTRNRPTEKGHVCSMTPSELGELRRIGDSLFRATRAVDAATPGRER